MPPAATSPASGEPPDEGTKALEAGGGGGGDDDDDGWGDFESA